MKTIKEYAEEFMQQISDDLCIPYSATMVDLFVRYLNKYKKEIKELIDDVKKKINNIDLSEEASIQDYLVEAQEIIDKELKARIEGKK